MSDAHALYLARMSNAVVASGTVLGRGCVIHAFAIVGMQPMLHPTLARQPALQRPLVLCEDVAVGPHAVVYAGTIVGRETFIGNHASIREGCRIGARCVIGTGVTVGYDVTLGDDVKLQDGAHITGGMRIGDGTFVGLNVTTCNDPRREIVDYAFVGAKAPIAGRKCLIGSGAVLLPGVRIGDGAVVGAGALVTKDVPAGATVLARGSAIRGADASLIYAAKEVSDGERQLAMLRSAMAADVDAQPVLAEFEHRMTRA